MLQTIPGYIPQLIILGALFYYLIRKRNTLSVLLFCSYLACVITGQLQIYQSLSMRGDFSEKARALKLLGILSFISYTFFAIAFLMLIINILKPAAQDYQFLDDSKQSNNAPSENSL
ncbi:hypothetical protein LL912_22420 [Niabella sp. CC-SYL272]|uniref:hypothetical protein n=1 Tax=Niabella agricola TaxID=2891571 RepID=UPI001F31104C|nr:hypothetical protein [Niabella agricola]MCF3111558.1 hypothetical protein [Niabella agricola]